MLNLILFTGSTIFSGFGMGLMFNFISFYVFSFKDAVFYSAISYVTYESSKALFSFFTGFFVDRFKKKTILVYADLALAVFVAFSFLYLNSYGIGKYSCVIGSVLFAATRTLAYLATKSAMPLIFKNEMLIRANAFEISIPKIAMVFGYMYFNLYFRNQKELLVFILSGLILISAIMKSFLVIEEVKAEKDSSSSVGVFGIKSVSERKSVWLLSLISGMAELFFFSFILIVVPSILKLGGYQMELESHIIKFHKLLPRDPENIRLLIRVFWTLLLSFFPFFGSVFLYMFMKKFVIPKNKRIAQFLVGVSLVMSCWNVYDLFFNGISSFMFNIGYIKITDLQYSLNMFLLVVGIVGIFLSVIFFQIFGKTYDLVKGIKVTTYMYIPISFLIFCIMLYFGFFGKGDILKLTTCLAVVLAFFYFTLNSQEVYRTTFFQERIPFSRSGRFFGYLGASYVVSRNMGNKLYGVTDSIVGLTILAFLPFLISLLIIFIFKMFEKNVNKKD